MVNDNQFEGLKWEEFKSGLKNLWRGLPEDELDQFKGNISEVTSIVEERYGETKEEIKKKLEQLINSFDNDTDKGISPDESSYLRSPIRDFAADKNAHH